MKKRREIQLVIFFVAMSVLFLLPRTNVTASEADRKEVLIDGVSYKLYPETKTGIAALPSPYNCAPREELTIPNQIVYEGVAYNINIFTPIPEIEDYRGAGVDFTVPKIPSYHSDLKKITIEKGIRISGPFDNFYALEEIVFQDPADVMYTSFYGCPKLKSIYIPKEVKNRIFIKECENVTVTIDSENPYLSVYDNDIYTKDGKTLLNVTGGTGEYRVRDSVTTIGDCAFYGSKGITDIYIPNSVKTIKMDAFGDMENLEHIRLSKNMKVLESGLFRKCPKLTTLTLPKNIVSMKGAFGGEYQCSIKKLKILAKSLKKSSLKTIPKTCTIYVKNNTVKNQVKKYKFTGKIVVKANLK